MYTNDSDDGATAALVGLATAAIAFTFFDRFGHRHHRHEDREERFCHEGPRGPVLGIEQSWRRPPSSSACLQLCPPRALPCGCGHCRHLLA